MKQAYEITPFGFLSNSKQFTTTDSCGSISAKAFSHYVDTSEGSGEVGDLVLKSNDNNIKKQFEFKKSKIYFNSCNEAENQPIACIKEVNEDNALVKDNATQHKQKSMEFDDFSDSNLTLISNSNASWINKLYWAHLLKTPDLTGSHTDILDGGDSFGLNDDENDMNVLNLNWDSPLQSTQNKQDPYDLIGDKKSLNNNQCVKKSFLPITSNSQSENCIRIRLVKAEKEEKEQRYTLCTIDDDSSFANYSDNMIASKQKSSDELMEPSRKKIKIVENRKLLKYARICKSTSDLPTMNSKSDTIRLTNPSKMIEPSNLGVNSSSDVGELTSLHELRDATTVGSNSKIQTNNKNMKSGNPSKSRCRTELRMLFWVG